MPRTFQCGTCQRNFMRAADLSRHVLTHDRNARRYKCAWEDCEHSSLQKSNLKTHYLSIHLRMTPYRCTIGGCTLAFGDASALIRHEKDQHGYYRKQHGPRPRMTRIHLDDAVYIKSVVKAESPVPTRMLSLYETGRSGSSSGPTSSVTTPPLTLFSEGTNSVSGLASNFLQEGHSKEPMKEAKVHDGTSINTLICGRRSEHAPTTTNFPVPLAEEYPAFEDFAPCADVTSFEWWYYFASCAWRQ